MSSAPLPRAWPTVLRHRGPDDHGVWADAAAGVALGHTRLAIIDLSAAGAQPMVSACGRFVLSYNGEVFNAPELRAALEAKGRALSRALRHRSHGRGLCRLGRAGHGRAPDRHVRLRRLGPFDPHAHAWARSPRHQAALLGTPRRQPRVRLGTEGACTRSPAGGARSTATLSRRLCATATCRRR